MTHPVINVRFHRRRWALGQDELATLLGISQSIYSRIESGEKPATVRLLVALQVIFGLSLRRILPALYHQIEEAIMGRAVALDKKWATCNNYNAERKRQLLSAMVYRVRGSDQAA